MPRMDDAAPGTTSPPGIQPPLISSAFNYAHDFSMSNPVFAEQATIIYSQEQPSDYQALSWLGTHTLRMVELNSAAREPPPRCYPGTRESFQSEFQEWLDQAKNSPQKVACLYGPAGVGKSAIAQSVAERALTDRNLLGAAVFLDQPSSRSEKDVTFENLSRLWSTIAYRLAVNYPSYMLHIRKVIARDPKIVDQSMDQQFYSMITEPFGVQGLLNDSLNIIPIFIDGLDQLGSPNLQEQTMRLILEFARTYSNASLAWIITFREETYLMRNISNYLDSEELIRRVPVSMHSAEAKKDVQVFMTSKFREMQRRYRIISPIPWPIEETLIRLLVSASGLFIFASAIIVFCENCSVADPAFQLDALFSLITNDPNHPQGNPLQHPLNSVHVMYRRILDDVPLDIYDRYVRRILGFLLLPNGYGVWTPESTSFWALCNILNIDQRIAYACLRKLTSVLAIPTFEDAKHTPLQFHHMTLANYLLDKNVSGKFYINKTSVANDLQRCHSRALKQANSTKAFQLPRPSRIKLSWPSTSEAEESEFRIDFWENARRMCFHCSPYPLPSSTSTTSQAPHYVEIISQVHFPNLVDGYAFPELPYKFITFLDWLLQLPDKSLGATSDTQLKEHFDPLISRKRVSLYPGSDIWSRLGICFKIQIEHFDDGGRITTFKSYKPVSHPLGPPLEVDPSRFFSTREPSESIVVLQRELSGRSDLASVTISEICHILVDTSFPRYKFYYILSKLPK